MQPEPVAEYLDALARELSFDRVLARRVCKEAEDHLREAAACEPDSATPEAQRRAIASFGDPREIARRYAPLSLYSQVRRAGTSAILTLGAVLAVMLARVAWYHFFAGPPGNDLQGIRTAAFSVIRYSFFFALAGGTLAWMYTATRSIPNELRGAFSWQLNVGLLLCGTTVAALLVSTTAGAVLSAFRLVEMPGLAPGVIAVLLMLVEIALVGTLFYKLRETIRRTLRIHSLL